MTLSLTLVFITARVEPRYDWLLSSLLWQEAAKRLEEDDVFQVIAVDLLARKRELIGTPQWFRIVEPKPNMWQGKHRLTKRDWWAASNARNTGICLCDTEWIAFADDRAVLGPQWLEAVMDAMIGGYGVVGAYEKHYGLQVANGRVASSAKVDSLDPRLHGGKGSRKIPGSHLFGCTSAMPLEWALEVNGWPEDGDGMGLEDCVFGSFLEARNKPLRYDPRMMIVEDRTPGECESLAVRSDYGVSPKDKSHAFLARNKGRNSSQHQWNLRDVRERVLRGESWPIPDGPTHDWFTGVPLAEMEPQ